MSQTNHVKKRELPSWLWLWFPLCILMLLFAVHLYDYKLVRHLIGEEGGFIELATPLVLLPAIYAGIICFIKRSLFQNHLIIVWVMLVTLACVYFAGEEVSWGQHLYSWQTPEAITAINDQYETNIHNISSWFDQKPRILLELWILIGGILLPVYCQVRKKTYTSDQWQFWFWPTMICLPTAVLAIAVKLPERLESVLHIVEAGFHVRYSELQEFYFALFLFLYLFSCMRRLNLLQSKAETSA